MNSVRPALTAKKRLRFAKPRHKRFAGQNSVWHMDRYQNFLDRHRTKHFKKGEIIIYQGQLPPYAYVSKSGIIKTYNLTSQGEEKPIGYDVEQEVFPVAWVFGKAKKAQYYYEAFSNCEIYCVKPTDYVNFLAENPDVLMRAFLSSVERSMGFQLRINALEQSKACHKVINTLHFLALRFGNELQPDKIRLDINLTQQDIANLTGLTRETAGMELKKLDADGVIGRKGRQYVIRTDRLNALLDEEYDLNLKEKKTRLKL